MEVILFFRLVTNIFPSRRRGPHSSTGDRENRDTGSCRSGCMRCLCPAYLLYLTDVILRISMQPCAGKVGLAQREDMVLFDLLPKPRCIVILRPCRMWLRSLLIIWVSYLDNSSESACTTIYVANNVHNTHVTNHRNGCLRVGRRRAVL